MGGSIAMAGVTDEGGGEDLPKFQGPGATFLERTHVQPSKLTIVSAEWTIVLEMSANMTVKDAVRELMRWVGIAE